jgi:1-acyl-sn-glycerol-3-phosphate acyltransferase
MRAANGIPVPRGAKRTEALVEATKERASRGISVLTFPEAHRTMDGRVRPFRRGAFVMAREAGLPIVPIGIRGMYHVLPKGSWVVNPGHLEIFMGRAYETQGLSDAELEALVEEVHRVIANWVENGVLPEGTVTQKSPRSAD